MKKSVLMALAIPFLLLAFVGCSKDDAEKSDLKVRFKVLNAKGEETSVFKHGEDILFELTVMNEGEKPVEAWKIIDLHDVFHVYTSDGKDMGKPWNEIYDPFYVMRYIPAHGDFNWLCSWLEKKNFFIQKRPRTALPVGDYVARFNVTLENKHMVECKVDFKVE